MEIRTTKETLILTQTEKAILSKASAILNDIYDECEAGGTIEIYACGAKEYLENLLEDAEVENGEPKEAIHVTIIM